MELPADDRLPALMVRPNESAALEPEALAAPAEMPELPSAPIPAGEQDPAAAAEASNVDVAVAEAEEDPCATAIPWKISWPVPAAAPLAAEDPMVGSTPPPWELAVAAPEAWAEPAAIPRPTPETDAVPELVAEPATMPEFASAPALMAAPDPAVDPTACAVD